MIVIRAYLQDKVGAIQVLKKNFKASPRPKQKKNKESASEEILGDLARRTEMPIFPHPLEAVALEGTLWGEGKFQQNKSPSAFSYHLFGSLVLGVIFLNNQELIIFGEKGYVVKALNLLGVKTENLRRFLHEVEVKEINRKLNKGKKKRA